MARPLPIETAVLVSPSIHGAHIRANVSGRSIKWKWSGDIPPETDVLARFTHRRINPRQPRPHRCAASSENDSRVFGTNEKEIERMIGQRARGRVHHAYDSTSRKHKNATERNSRLSTSDDASASVPYNDSDR